MRSFLVLCFATITAAFPGYDYQQPGFQEIGVSHGRGISTSTGFQGNEFNGVGNRLSGNSGGNGFSHTGAGVGIGGVGVGSGISTGSIGVTTSSSGNGISGFFGRNHIHQHSHGAAIVTKNFYIHSAPDEQDEPIHKTISLGPARKNYRVVFIKAPSGSSSAAKISLIQPQNEEKTVIYVLAKKTDGADIQTDVQAAPSQPSKPEVFFIKYKTQEEALHAQRQIQAQYDALEGTSQVSDEGVAPITSVIGSVGLGNGGSSFGHSTSVSQGSSILGTSGISINNNYLPPN